MRILLEPILAQIYTKTITCNIFIFISAHAMQNLANPAPPMVLDLRLSCGLIFPRYPTAGSCVRVWCHVFYPVNPDTDILNP
jgi:hypothetical protein